MRNNSRHAYMIPVYIKVYIDSAIRRRIQYYLLLPILWYILGILVYMLSKRGLLCYSNRIHVNILTIHHDYVKLLKCRYITKYII